MNAERAPFAMEYGVFLKDGLGRPGGEPVAVLFSAEEASEHMRDRGFAKSRYVVLRRKVSDWFDLNEKMPRG